MKENIGLAEPKLQETISSEEKKNEEIKEEEEPIRIEKEMK